MVYRVVNTDLCHNGKYYPEGGVIDEKMIDAAIAVKLSHILQVENPLQDAAAVLSEPPAREIPAKEPPASSFKTGNKKKNT